jgi:hypothetical protein
VDGRRLVVPEWEANRVMPWNRRCDDAYVPIPD